MEDNKKSTTLAQREYQKRYDKKTKMLSVKYVLSDMKDYDRLMKYLEKTGQSANGFIKELIKDFFEKEKYVLNDKKVADYFKDYNVDGELLDRLKNMVGKDKFDIIMDYHRDCIESDLYNAFIDRGDEFDKWVEQFIRDIECGDIDINVSEKDFIKIIDSSISDCMGNIYFG